MPERIVHFAQDEKFINSAYRQFEAVYPGRNEFQIITDKPDFKYVTAQPRIHGVRFDDALQEIVPLISGADLVVFHSLADVFIPLVLALRKEVPTVWICFGYEVYNDRSFYSEDLSFDRLTKARFASPKPSAASRFKSSLYELLQNLKPDRKPDAAQLKRQAIARIDYLTSSFDEELQAIQKLIGHKKKPFAFWYYPIENIVDVDAQVPEQRPNILVGNSGHATGNHLDVFEKIRGYGLGDRKVVVPLSYGNKPYIDAILPLGQSMLGSNFSPLTDFYKLEDYNAILQRCGIAILNCRRQQALGNTIALVWFGSKVFLSRHNPFFHYLRRIGVMVYSYEDDLNAHSCSELLTSGQIAENRKALLQHLNADRLLSELKADIEAIHYR